VLRLVAELPLPSVNVRHRPLTVAVIVTQIITRRMAYFVCGPEPFQDAMEEILPRLGGAPRTRAHRTVQLRVGDTDVRHVYTVRISVAIAIIVVAACLVFAAAQAD
jgi:hypothetical protein